ncbi:MAG: response regulator transcription factor [Candidatus Rokubacteria bacterium]|nr:response regulator transcription factor [Candidatus Rokubacteria bacterium]
MKPIRVLVVDDHALFRKGVASLLRPAEGFTVVGEAQDGREAVAKARALAPDVVLIDVYMPEMDGLEATRRIKAAIPSTRIIVLTVSEDDQNLFAALKAGAQGYLLKSVEPDELFRTVRGVVHGEAFVNPSMAAKVLAELTRPAGAPREAPADVLSPREREVLGLLTEGAVNKEIAAALDISENTVKNHLKSIMEKLHVENRVQAVARALREGLATRHGAV